MDEFFLNFGLAPQQLLEDPGASISLHDEPQLHPQRDAPQGQQRQQNQQPLPYSVNRIIESYPPPRQENHNNAPTHGYQVDNQGNFYHNNFNLQHNSPPQQAQLQNYPNGRDALSNNRIGQKQLQDQNALNDKGTEKRHRDYKKKMTGKKWGKTPFVILAYLAIKNGYMPLPVWVIYEFVKFNFPGCITPGSQSWENSLRGNLHNHEKLFEKLHKDQVADPIPAKKKDACYYAIRQGPEAQAKLRKELGKMMKKGWRVEEYGLRDPADWEEIFNGTKGLPPLAHELQRLVQEEEEEKEDIMPPPVKRSRHEEEAQRAANNVEQLAEREEEYAQHQHRGYDNQMYRFQPIPQMAVPAVNMGFQINNMAYGHHFNLNGEHIPYLDVNQYDPNAYDFAFNQMPYDNDENQDPAANQSDQR